MSPELHTTNGEAPGPALRSTLSPAARIVIALLLLSPFGVGLLRLGRSPASDALAAAGDPGRPRAATPRHASGLPKPLLGFAINAHHIGNLPIYLDGVDEIARLGANTLIVVTPMYQKKVDSTRVRVLRQRCPTGEQLTAILRRAKQHAMSTVLMPIVLIEEPGPKDWRGLINPTDWQEWWTSYERTLDRFVDLASREGVDLLSVGSELNTTEDQVDRWRGVIARIRDRFPGRITYSANWDRYDRTKIWPLVDVMSVSAYFELERDRPGAPQPDLVAAWSPIRAALLRTAREHGKPLMLSEVGYPSLPWANAHPWNYVADGNRSDPAAQARSWRAFFEAWRDTIADPGSAVLGFCGYRWDPYHRGENDDTGYGIRGKPAHEVIRGGMRAIRETATKTHADR